MKYIQVGERKSVIYRIYAIVYLNSALSGWARESTREAISRYMFVANCALFLRCYFGSLRCVGRHL